MAVRMDVRDETSIKSGVRQASRWSRVDRVYTKYVFWGAGDWKSCAVTGDEARDQANARRLSPTRASSRLLFLLEIDKL